MIYARFMIEEEIYELNLSVFVTVGPVWIEFPYTQNGARRDKEEKSKEKFLIVHLKIDRN